MVAAATVVGGTDAVGVAAAAATACIAWSILSDMATSLLLLGVTTVLGGLLLLGLLCLVLLGLLGLVLLGLSLVLDLLGQLSLRGLLLPLLGLLRHRGVEEAALCLGLEWHGVTPQGSRQARASLAAG